MPLNRVWFLGFCQRFCLEQGIRFATPTLEHGRGVYLAARTALQTNAHVVAVPARVPLRLQAVSDSKSTASHIFQSGTGYLFSPGGKIGKTQGSTPPPPHPPGKPQTIHVVLRLRPFASERPVRDEMPFGRVKRLILTATFLACFLCFPLFLHYRILIEESKTKVLSPEGKVLGSSPATSAMKRSRSPRSDYRRYGGFCCEDIVKLIFCHRLTRDNTCYNPVVLCSSWFEGEYPTGTHR